MGIASGIVWILIGICYIAYKYLHEECSLPKDISVLYIVAGWAIFFASGLILMSDMLPLMILFADLIMWGLYAVCRYEITQAWMRKSDKGKVVKVDPALVQRNLLCIHIGCLVSMVVLIIIACVIEYGWMHMLFSMPQIIVCGVGVRNLNKGSDFDGEVNESRISAKEFADILFITACIIMLASPFVGAYEDGILFGAPLLTFLMLAVGMGCLTYFMKGGEIYSVNSLTRHVPPDLSHSNIEDDLPEEEKVFRREWFYVNNEYLTEQEVHHLYKLRHGVVGDKVYSQEPWSQIAEYQNGYRAYLQTLLPFGAWSKLNAEEQEFLTKKVKEILQDEGLNAAREYIIWQFGECPAEPFQPYVDVMKDQIPSSQSIHSDENSFKEDVISVATSFENDLLEGGKDKEDP